MTFQSLGQYFVYRSQVVAAERYRLEADQVLLASRVAYHRPSRVIVWCRKKSGKQSQNSSYRGFAKLEPTRVGQAMHYKILSNIGWI